MNDFMTDKELGELLNQLLEAERAGAKLLAAWLSDLPPQSPFFTALRDVQRDEASNCAVLIECLRAIDIEPSARTGDFYAKALPIQDWRERLEFLNRGQAWVGRRIAAALPVVQAPTAKAVLQEMHDSHFANIERCKELITARAP